MVFSRDTRTSLAPVDITATYNTEKSHIDIGFASRPREYVSLLSNAYRHLNDRRNIPVAKHVNGINTAMYIPWKSDTPPENEMLRDIAVDIENDVNNILKMRKELDSSASLVTRGTMPTSGDDLALYESTDYGRRVTIASEQKWIGEFSAIGEAILLAHEIDSLGPTGYLRRDDLINYAASDIKQWIEKKSQGAGRS